MADGTVTGEFRITAVQARRELAQTRREAERTDVAMEKLGSDMDTVGSTRQLRQVRTYRGETRAMGSDARRSERDVHRLARTTEDLGDAAEFASTGVGRRRHGRGGGIGGLGGRIGKMGALAVLALPGIRALTGGVVALAGAVASAAGGAGVVGAAGLGGLLTGLGGIASVALPAASAIKQAADAQKKYNDAVKQFGAGSQEALDARTGFRASLRGAPRGTRNLLSNARAFSTEWRKATREGAESLVGFANAAIRTGRRLTPFLSGLANQVTEAFSLEGRRFARFVGRSRAVRGGLRAGAGIFTDNLGNVRRIGQDVVVIFSNIMRAARPFVREFSDFLERWFGRQAGRSRNIERLRSAIGTMVDDLKSLGRLGGAGVRLILTLLTGGRAQGRSLIDSLTGQLNTWNEWLKRNPQKVQAFFAETAGQVRTLATAAKDIAGAVSSLARDLGPLIPGLGRLAQLIATLGPGLTLTAGAAGLGALRGFRGGGGGGGAAGLLGLLGRGGGGARGAVAPGARAAAGAAGGASLLGRLGGAARGGLLAGAARFATPITAALFGLGALGTEGSIGRRLQGGLSTLLPFVPAPPPFSELQAQGAAGATRFAQGVPLGATLRGARGGLGRVNRERQRIRAELGRQEAVFIPQVGARGVPTGQGRTVLRPGVSEDERQRLTARLRQLDDEAKSRQLVVDELKAERRARGALRGARVAGRTVTAAQRVTAAQGAVAGAQFFSRETMHQIGRESTAAGRLEIAKANVAWLNEQRKHNPALNAIYEALVTNVKRKFERLHQNIVVINGKVYKDTHAAWRNIEKNLEDPVERAKQQQQQDFTTMQRNAVKALVLLGYSRATARGIVEGKEAGGIAGRASANALRLGPSGTRGRETQQADPRGPGSRARGGRLRGFGMGDSVPMADGGLGAPGELVVNRHTERSHDRDAAMFGLPSLASRVAHEGRRHSAPPIGGPADAGPGAARGLARARTASTTGLMGASASLLPFVQLGQNMGLHVSSGLRVGSVTTSGNVSLHASGHAVDMADGPEAMLAYARVMARRYGPGLDELIHTPLGYGIKRGKRVPLSFWGPAVNAEHFSHVHVGDVAPGGAVLGGVGALQGITVRVPRNRLGGVPGALATGSATAYARGLQAKVNAALGAGGGAGGGQGTSGQNQALGKRMMLAQGFPASEWPSLRALWQRESGWDANAVNKSSGAAGIPQALGHGHVFNLGDAGAQIGWGLQYIRQRYGSPSRAWAHEQSAGWYGHGGRLHNRGWFRNGGHFLARGPTVFGAGEGGTEEVSIGPRGSTGRPVIVNVNMGTVKVASVGEAGEVGDKIGRAVARKIATALREAPLAS